MGVLGQIGIRDTAVGVEVGPGQIEELLVDFGDAESFTTVRIDQEFEFCLCLPRS